jgi:hypothetical protein
MNMGVTTFRACMLLELMLHAEANEFGMRVWDAL